ncbi:MAG: pilus assembly protein PilE [Pseudomonas sp.]|nr:type IV pilin protein [Pseudomonas sp.]MBA4242930.1 pilus assembly protein PilE [Pseudomonas sp.]
MKKYAQQGFTLIEVMLVVVIVGILAAIAIPNYQDYITRSKRAEGMAMLQEMSARQERFYAQNNRYVTVDEDIDLLVSDQTSVIDADTAGARVLSNKGSYLVAVSRTDGDGGYTLTAAPNAPFSDPACGNLTLTAVGIKGKTSTGPDAKTVDQCWR